MMNSNFISDLVKLADDLDKKGLHQEADLADRLILSAQEGPVMEPKIRNAVNRELTDISTGNNHKYYDSVGVAFQQMVDVLKKNGVVALQEDSTEFQGFFTGKQGRVTIPLAPTSSKNDEFYTEYANTLLALSWHKMENNTYEVLAYVS